MFKKEGKYNFLNTKISYYGVALILLIGIICIGKWIWLNNDASLPSENALNDLMPAGQMYWYMKEAKDFSFQDLLLQEKAQIQYPPLLPLSYAIFFYLFGNSLYNQVLMVNCIYLAILLFSIYGIGSRLFNKKAGLFSVFILSSFPIIVGFSITPSSSFSTMCLVSLSLYLLLLTDYFKSSFYSILFGLSMGLAALSKWDFWVYIVGPLMVVIWNSRAGSTGSLSKEQLDGKKINFIAPLNILISLLLGFLTALIWYVPRAQDILFYFFSSYGPIHATHTPDRMSVFSFRSLLYYANSLIQQQITLVYFFIFITAIFILFFYAFRKKSLFRQSLRSLFLTSWFVIPYFFYSLIPVKRFPHTIGIVAPVAIVISAGILRITNRVSKIIAICFIIFYGLSLHLHPFNFFRANPFIASTRFLYRTFYPAVKGESKPKFIENMYKCIVDDSEYIAGCDYSTVIPLLSDSEPLSYSDLLYVSLFKYREIKLIIPYDNYRIIIDRIKSCSYLIMEKAESYADIHGRRSKEMTRKFIDSQFNFNEQFELLKTLEYMDTEFSIFRNKSKYKITSVGPDSTTFEAENFSTGRGISTDGSHLGLPMGMLYDDGSPSGQVIYLLDFLKSGEYELWTRYTMHESRPVSIQFDERLICSDGLSQVTGGDMENTLRWLREASLNVSSGKHYLKFIFLRHLPHIDALKFVKVSK